MMCVETQSSTLQEVTDMKDEIQYLAYDQIDLISIASIIVASLWQLPREKAAEIIQKIYNPAKNPAVDEEELEVYVADRLNCLSRIMVQDPHREYADPEMAKTECSAEALAKVDPSEITKRLLEHDNTIKLLECLYLDLTA